MMELESSFWDNGEIYRQDSSFYDAAGQVFRYSGIDESDTITRQWNYRNETELDTAGRVLKKISLSEGKTILVEVFHYDRRGLLLSKETTHSMMGGFRTTERFRYTFYVPTKPGAGGTPRTLRSRARK